MVRRDHVEVFQNIRRSVGQRVRRTQQSESADHQQIRNGELEHVLRRCPPDDREIEGASRGGGLVLDASNVRRLGGLSPLRTQFP
jgi:hypothetical protein